MKRMFIVLACMVVAGMAWAKVPAKSEMAVSGSYYNPEEGDQVWVVDGHIAMPISDSGKVILGPQVHLSSGTDDAFGAVLEWNFLGTNKSGPFLGGNGLYLQNDVEGLDRYSVNGIAGVKVQIGTGGFVKVFASAPVAGAGKDLTKITGNVGIGIRF